MKKSILFIQLFLLLISNSLIAQVSSVKYLMEYDDQTSYYDCKLVIDEGEAMDYIDRIQFNSQYTIVVPAESIVTIDTLYNPKENNQFYTSTIPCLWECSGKEFSPPSQPQNDFYSILPNLSPPSAYNDLKPGDTVTLFSIFVDADPCEHFVRPFINGSDPLALEMPGGGDFSNAFTLGSSEQLYSGNMMMADYNICAGECVELTPSLMCYDNLTYLWSTGEYTPSITVCPDETTTYSVEITNINMEVLALTSTVEILNPIVEITGSDSICVNGTTTLIPNTGGTWVSSNSLVGTVDNSGNVTGLNVGTVVFTHTDLATGCSSNPSDTVWVLASPEVEITGDDRICIGETTTVASNQTGTWVSNNPAVATVDHISGLVTGVGQGAVTITLTDNIAGCTATTLGIIVDPYPSVSTIDDSICIAATTNLNPSAGGTWTALNPAIASLVGNTVTGQASGDAGFVFTADATGCDSDILYINVESGATTTLTGPNQICIGGTTTIEPSVGGLWASADETIATIDNFGYITGVGAGVTTFTFTSASTLCASDPSEPVWGNAITYCECSID